MTATFYRALIGHTQIHLMSLAEDAAIIICSSLTSLHTCSHWNPVRAGALSTVILRSSYFKKSGRQASEQEEKQ